MSIFERWQTGIETKTSAEKLPKYLSMYKIPGHEQITYHSFVRYQKDKKQDKAIKEAADFAANYKKRIKNSSPEDMITLIEQGLAENNVKTQIMCVEMIRYVKEIGKRFSLIEKVIDIDNEELQAACAEAVRYVPLDKRDILIEKGLNSNNEEIQAVYAEMIRCVQEGRRAALIEKCLDICGLKARVVAALMIFQYTTPKNRPMLEEKVAALVKNYLSSNNAKLQIGCIKMIWNAPKDQMSTLIEQGIDTNNIEVQAACAGMIEYIIETNERKKLRAKIYSVIEQGFETNDPEKHLFCAEMIRSIPTDQQNLLGDKLASLIKKILESDNSNEIKKVYAAMICYASENKKADLFKQAWGKLGNTLIEPPLYENMDMSKRKFSRMEFSKTGSETTLIGGKLKDKIIIRHITPESFLAWQKLYEDYEMWAKAGFDYVPIEPIQSFKLNGNGLVDVYSGVLDLNLDDWKKYIGGYDRALDGVKERIKGILIERGIIHGHDYHDGNFCLRFFRDKNGNIDFSKKPRVYIIDFDMATIM